MEENSRHIVCTFEKKKLCFQIDLDPTVKYFNFFYFTDAILTTLIVWKILCCHASNDLVNPYLYKYFPYFRIWTLGFINFRHKRVLLFDGIIQVLNAFRPERRSRFTCVYTVQCSFFENEQLGEKKKKWKNVQYGGRTTIIRLINALMCASSVCSGLNFIACFASEWRHSPPHWLRAGEAQINRSLKRHTLTIVDTPIMLI